MTRHTLWSHTAQRSLSGFARIASEGNSRHDDGVAFDVRQHVFAKYIGELGLETAAGV